MKIKNKKDFWKDLYKLYISIFVLLISFVISGLSAVGAYYHFYGSGMDGIFLSSWVSSFCFTILIVGFTALWKKELK